MVPNLRAEEAEEEESFSVTVATMGGKVRQVGGLQPSLRLEALVELATDALGVPEGLELCHGTKRFGFRDLARTLAQLGIGPGAALMGVCQAKEAWFYNPDLLQMPGTESLANQELRDWAVASALQNPPRNRSVAFAQEIAVARDAVLKEAEASTIKAESLGDYDGRRRSFAFAWAAMLARRQSLEAAEAATSWAEGGRGREAYESRRRTVEFAIRASEERERRLEALCSR